MDRKKKKSQVAVSLMIICGICVIAICTLLYRDSGISKTGKILAYMKEHEYQLSDEDEADYTLETVSVNNQTFQLLKTLVNDEFFVQLYMVLYDENKEIQNVVPCGGGIEELFEYGTVSISEGDFLYVYSSSNMGNGSIDFYDLNDSGKRRFSVEGCIDRQYEDSEETAAEYGVESEDNKAKASIVFKDDKLTPEFEELNGDGFTDLKLVGTKLLYSGDTTGEERIEDYWYGELLEVIPCEYIYYYNEDEDQFVLDHVYEERNEE